MHRCPWCGDPCDCDEVTDFKQDCTHDCGTTSVPDEDDRDDEDEED